MEIAHLFEASMLVCFGFSWPLNVMKAYRARTAKGTSLPFIILIITGYVAGISAKIINGQFNYVLAVYFLNLAIVMTNVFVYIRNKTLDKKAEQGALKIKNLNLKGIEPKEETMTNYTNSLDEIINRPAAAVEKKNAVILLGENSDREIPVGELAKEFKFNFEIYNKSCTSLTVGQAQEYFEKKIAQLKPEGILLHLGSQDYSSFKNDAGSFDRNYLSLIESIKSVNRKCRIALISVDNPANDKNISLMNAHIRAIADAEKASFISLENAKLWNPEATKASSDFAYSMGLQIRKPLRDVAQILYSYAYHNIKAETTETLVS